MLVLYYVWVWQCVKTNEHVKVWYNNLNTFALNITPVNKYLQILTDWEYVLFYVIACTVQQ